VNRAFGLLLWTFLAISIVLCVLFWHDIPGFVYPAVFASFMVLSWAAWYCTFNGVKIKVITDEIVFEPHLHRFAASIISLLVVWSLRIASKIQRWRERKQLAQERKPEEPLADRSLDLAATHPRILVNPMSVVIGYHSRKPVVANLGSAHTLIGGSTNAGKTNLVLSILIQLFSKSEELRPYIFLIDLKGNLEDGLKRFGIMSRCTYVDDIAEAVDLLRKLNKEMDRRNREGDTSKPVLVVIDEVADLTSGAEMEEYRKAAVHHLVILARKARSANINLVIATQHARFDILDKSITYNLLRKIMLVVDTVAQAEVILGFRPDFELPKKSGEFAMKDGIGIKRGKTLLVMPGEVNELVARQSEKFDDRRMMLWKDVSNGYEVGKRVRGIVSFLRDHPEYDQHFVKFGYRNLAVSGVLEPPSGQGTGYKVVIPFLEGIPIVRKFIADGLWKEQPKAFIEKDVSQKGK
jgi:hypothetical protein